MDLPPVRSVPWESLGPEATRDFGELTGRLIGSAGLNFREVYTFLRAALRSGAVLRVARPADQRPLAAILLVKRQSEHDAIPGLYRLSVLTAMRDKLPDSYLRSLGHAGVRRWMVTSGQPVCLYVWKEFVGENTRVLSRFFEPTPELGPEPPLSSQLIREDPGRLMLELRTD